MIKKLLFLFLACSNVSAATDYDTAHLVKRIFGTTGVNLSLVSFQFTEDLFHRIATSTPYEQRCACKKAGAILRQEIEKREASLTKVDTETKQHIEHNLAILIIQKDHYERVARLLKKEISKTQKIIGRLKNALAHFVSFVLSPFKKYTSPIQKLTNDLIIYTEIERNEILTDHKKTLRLLVCQNKYNIPLIIRFWDYPRHRHRLLNGVKKFQSSAQPQAVVIDLAAQVGAEGAEALARETAEGALAGVVEGTDEAAVDTTLETGEEDFLAASQNILNGILKTEEVTEETIKIETALASTTNALPAVGDSEITLGEATETIDEEGETLAETGEQRINNFEEEDEKANEDAAENTEKLTKEEKKALKVSKKEAQKALKAASKTAQKTAKAAQNTAQIAAQNAAKDAKVAEKSLKNYQASEKNLLEVEHAVALEKVKIPINELALDSAQKLLQEATNAHTVAFEESAATGARASNSAETAKTLRITADQAKIDATAAIVKAFGPIKTWAEQGKEFAEMMANLVIQMEVAMGSQMVAAWQSAADALVFASLSQKRTMLMTNLNHFFSQLAVQQTNVLAQINANFSAQIAVIAAQLCLQTTSAGTVVMSGLLPALFAVEQSSVTQALVKATVKSIFLLNPMPDDQLFYDSPMAAQKLIFSHTPFKSNGLSNSWYNPYRSGNWQFCSTDYSGITKGPVSSFVQYSAQPFTNATYTQGDPTLAVQNSIFTEYIPPAEYNAKSVESYTISVAVTLLSEPYEPFMMGIMFNGARWISGILDLHHQHRLFCIYSLPGQKVGTYNVGFAETFYQNQGQMNQTQDQLSDQNIAGLNAIWPAYQILSPNINALAALAKNNVANPITNPIATIPALPLGTPYIFTIETQPKQVTLIISTSDGKILYPTGETASNLKTELSLPNQIQNLNGLTFLYHNIGFTAPGCSAQFCLKKPTALCFSESQIKTIRASLDKGTS